MRTIDAKSIHDRVKNMVMEVATTLPQDVVSALEKAKAEESSESAREILRQLLENAQLARESGLPLCQDTGIAVFFGEITVDCRIQGGQPQSVPNETRTEE